MCSHFCQRDFLGLGSEIEVPQLLFLLARHAHHFVMEANTIWAAWPIHGKRPVEVVNDHMKQQVSTGWRYARAAGR